MFSQINIFDTQVLGEEVPKHFHAVKVSLDATLKSNLNWEKESDVAAKYSKKGFKIFWEMNLGIFSEMPFPLSDESQYLSLKFAITHFKEIFWEKFQKETVGVSLYRGSVDLSSNYCWDDREKKNFRDWLSDHKRTAANQERQLYCRDTTAEFLNLLAKEFPPTLETWLLFDTTEFDDPVHVANLLNKECFKNFHLGVKGDILPVQEMGWENKHSPFRYIGRDPRMNHPPPVPNIAISLPAKRDFHPQHYETLRQAFNLLSRKNRSYRLIPESLLMTNWEGLDEIVLSPHGLSPEGKRQLMGFCASGGKVIDLGESLKRSLF